MRAGRLGHRVTIQEKEVGQNSYGEEVITWADVGTVWAAVEPLRGQEFTELRRAGAAVTTRIIMRFQSGIVPEMRIIEGTNTYDILSVINVDGRDRELQLMCREVL